MKDKHLQHRNSATSLTFFSLFPEIIHHLLLCFSLSDGLCAGKAGCFVRLSEERLRQGVHHEASSWRQGEKDP